MKADTMITKEMLVEKGACEDGKGRFNLVFPNGGKYQDVLNACDKLDKSHDKEWLISRLGEVEPNHKWKQGDKARVIANTNSHPFNIGEIVTLGTDACAGAFRCTSERLPNISSSNWVRTTDIEPAVKEVKRPAKVGEWVEALIGQGGFIYKDEIYRVRDVDTRQVWVNDPTGKYSCVNTIRHDNYVVLEGYEPPKEEAKEQNKYEKMTDDELMASACARGSCSALCSTRKKDCPLANHGGCYHYFKTHTEIRPELIQYCIDEDAAKEQHAEEPTKPNTRVAWDMKIIFDYKSTDTVPVEITYGDTRYVRAE